MESLPTSTASVSTVLPILGFLPCTLSLAEISVKIMLNALSTGAHVLKGTVYRNRMINVMLTNVKLYHRASRIVSETTGCDLGTGGFPVYMHVFRSPGLER
jgi:hypothetical protein